MEPIQYLWKDRKRHLGLPLSFTRYRLSEDRLFCEKGFFNIKADEVLLLDDVLSELDPRRQEFVLNRINGGQVFITCCEDDRLPQMLGGKVLHVHGGELI